MTINMLSKKIAALLALLQGDKNLAELAENIGSTYVRTSQIAKELERDGYLVRRNGRVEIAATAHAAMFRVMAKRYDATKLLRDSGEDVAQALLDSGDIEELRKQIGLSYRTLLRTLQRMMESGAVAKTDGAYRLTDDEDLRLFLRLWRSEKRRRLVEPYAEVVYASAGVILKRVPAGKKAIGRRTAFSAFGQYGVQLNPVYDYYIQPERKLSVEEVLTHALVFSASPVEATDCAVFYAKNSDRIDLGKLRTMARGYGVDDAAIDLENYVQGLNTSKPERFLPWDEFAQKAELYGMTSEDLLPPAANPRFTEELSSRLDTSVDIYIIGGEAMRIRGLKRATKDVDIIVEDLKAYTTLREALLSLGYRDLAEVEVNEADRKLNPLAILVREASPRMDIFVKRIDNAFTLTDAMRRRASLQRTGPLRLHIISNEDLFLLKSITEREGDLYDTAQLAKTGGFDWAVVLEELYNQEKETKRHYCMELLDCVEVLEGRTGIKAPILRKLRNHAIDNNIYELVKDGRATTLSQIRGYLEYPEYKIANSVNRLIKQGILAKRNGQLKAGNGCTGRVASPRTRVASGGPSPAGSSTG